ncbi:MAG TPA: zinc-binding dehydrogenase, partial [Gemmatimonadaceae bacterium]|nr:zinc-binding dehydrogenase [Gemmatimonadaceae bacterium]
IDYASDAKRDAPSGTVRELATRLAKGNAGDLMELKRLVDDGLVTPVIDRAYALEHVADALRYLEAGHTRGKIVVEVLSA